MRFLSMVRINERAGQRPSAQLMEDMGKLMTELSAAGSLLDTAGLQPTAEGKRVRLSRGRQTVMDGPFTEAKEVVAGYAMLQVASMDEALEITRRFLAVHGDDWDLECEVRQVMEHCPEAA
ncbi:transcriptional regulator [Rhodanobacter sp. 7MK24]|uniref:YciI family protein n=1 Tax=Rhodanobacter sp. 7MK24 TaxID=2775922 RepID=UPI0017805931|nr:YciI family protein [Rhodanobacter sp. 7MK24]MBD8882095.1 transcriptional regulator [Rhodanobacter sp. 7MK24]